MNRFLPTLLAIAIAAATVRSEEPTTIHIGSKKFTESVILAEMGVVLVENSGAKAKHHEQLGGTQFLWQALLKGEIDVYPEYTGTLLKDILKDPPDLSAALREHGIRMSRPFGFNNSYGLGMRAEHAKRLRIRTISDLRYHPQLRYGFSEEFRNRNDGWPQLRQHYRLDVPTEQIGVLDHDLAYLSLEREQIDVLDVYTTEGQIRKFDVTVLRDDRQFFPQYEAVWVYRAATYDRLQRRAQEKLLPGHFNFMAVGNGATGNPWQAATVVGLTGDQLVPAEFAALFRLEGAIPEADMLEMNREALDPGVSAKGVAVRYLNRSFELSASAEEESVFRYLLRLTGQHLYLVAVSLAAAVVIAIPLGIWAAKQPTVGQIILNVVATLQTIPSLALLVLLIPLMGLGAKPAIAALFLYSLLPIVRNTHAGLTDIAPSVRESAAALGLPPSAILRLVELPLAMRSILAGIKTAAVINVGTATLGALIDAGGFGQPILTGIRLYSPYWILLGAVPAAALALLVQGAFEFVERRMRRP